MGRDWFRSWGPDVVLEALRRTPSGNLFRFVLLQGNQASYPGLCFRVLSVGGRLFLASQRGSDRAIKCLCGGDVLVGVSVLDVGFHGAVGPMRSAHHLPSSRAGNSSSVLSHAGFGVADQVAAPQVYVESCGRGHGAEASRQ